MSDYFEQLQTAHEEIDRLKVELEEAVSSCRLWQTELGLEQSSCSIHLGRIIDLEKQLNASQALIAEAKEREDVDSMRIHLFDEEVQCLRKYLAEAKETTKVLRGNLKATLKQRNEARADVERWQKFYPNHAAAAKQARQEAAREIIQYIEDKGITGSGWNYHQVYEIDRSDIVELKQRFGLEGEG